MTQVGGVTISVNSEVYGTDGREGALADYVELRALGSSPMSKSDLNRLIEKSDDLIPSPMIIDGSEDDDYEKLSASELLSDSVFILIEQRMSVLRFKYPFYLHKGKLRARPHAANTTYMALLSICVTHAWGITGLGADPKKVFENLVVDALGELIPCAGMGTGTRPGLGFVDSLQQSVQALGLAAMPSPTPRRASAKDAGVDVLGAHVWPDERSGHWVFIGQVTCAKTDRWRAKIKEPEPVLWQGYLMEPFKPTRFLAVPHHVADKHFKWIQQIGDGALIDRLRLCLIAKGVSEQCQLLIDAVLSATVE